MSEVDDKFLLQRLERARDECLAGKYVSQVPLNLPDLERLIQLLGSASPP